MIPKIIHLIGFWPNDPQCRSLLLTRYRNLYPDYEVMHWDEPTAKTFIGTHYPTFASQLEKLKSQESKEILLKYLILEYWGGVYFDQQVIPLRSMDQVLAGNRTVLAFDQKKRVTGQKSTLGITESFIASEPNGDFVKACLAALLQQNRRFWAPKLHRKKHESAMLRHLVQGWVDYSGIRVLRNVLLPFIENASESVVDDNIKKALQFAYAARLEPRGGLSSATNFADSIQQILEKYTQPTFPLISALCVSNNDPRLVARCIQSFNDQVYENKELVLIYENSSKARTFIEQINQPNIRIFNESDPARKKTLGELRNIGIEKCRGKLITQWDDDDCYDPHRMIGQYLHLAINDSKVCILNELIIYNSITKKYARSKQRVWEGSILFEKKLAVDHDIWYGDLPKGEDTIFIDKLKQVTPFALLHDPFLYLYVTHEHNTFDYQHHELLVRTVFTYFKTFLSSKDLRLRYFRSRPA